jgi:FolB domain-containing protein
MDKVLIRNLHVQAVIGIDDNERSQDWDLVINLELFTDTRAASKSDRIEDCVNYALVAHQVREYVKNAATHTVEALAEGIVEVCFTFPGVHGACVRVEKPGAVRMVESVGVEITRFLSENVNRENDSPMKNNLIVKGGYSNGGDGI